MKGSRVTLNIGIFFLPKHCKFLMGTTFQSRELLEFPDSSGVIQQLHANYNYTPITGQYFEDQSKD